MRVPITSITSLYPILPYKYFSLLKKFNVEENVTAMSFSHDGGTIIVTSETGRVMQLNLRGTDAPAQAATVDSAGGRIGGMALVPELSTVSHDWDSSFLKWPADLPQGIQHTPSSPPHSNRLPPQYAHDRLAPNQSATGRFTRWNSSEKTIYPQHWP